MSAVHNDGRLLAIQCVVNKQELVDQEVGPAIEALFMAMASALEASNLVARQKGNPHVLSEAIRTLQDACFHICTNTEGAQVLSSQQH